jgi:signal transduction histidine kinase
VNRDPLPDLRTDVATLYETLRKAEERAVAGQLALEVMHEIRNPLEALANLVYLTSMEAEDQEKVQEFMRLAEEQIAQANRIASQTLGYVRAAPSPQPTDLVDIAEAALRIHRSTLQKKRIHLVRRFPEQLVGEVHTSQMLQVLSNLISNALDALPTEGLLCLRLKKSHDSVQIVVADNGHGIPKDSYEEIFRPFYTTKGHRGTGLGLAISKSIVEKHGGKLRVRSSVRPGNSGTTFKISLPVSAKTRAG